MIDPSELAAARARLEHFVAVETERVARLMERRSDPGRTGGEPESIVSVAHGADRRAARHGRRADTMCGPSSSPPARAKERASEPVRERQDRL